MTIAVAIALVLIACGPEAQAQYMFLDSNGDGRNDHEDQLPRLGWSQVDVWLDTTRNRDGTPSSLAGGVPQGVAAYEILLQVSATSVEGGRFLPAETSMRVVRGPLMNSRSFYVRVECERPLRPGKHKLGRIRLNPSWGGSTVNILPCGVVRDTVGTSFQARPGGPRFRLGPTVSFAPSPVVVTGEWHDADGVYLSSRPRPSAGSIRVESGFLYLGWNRMEPPFELRIIRGRAAINGLTTRELPRPARLKHSAEVLNSYKAAYNADIFAYSAGILFHDLGLPDSASQEAFVAAYRLSPSVESVSVVHGLEVFPRGPRPLPSYKGVPGGWGPHRPPPEPESLMVGVLNEWARVLRAGHLLQIKHLGSTTTVPASRGRDLDRAIRSLQEGETLSAADTVALLDVAPLAEWGAIAHPAPLEKIRQ